MKVSVRSNNSKPSSKFYFLRFCVIILLLCFVSAPNYQAQAESGANNNTTFITAVPVGQLQATPVISTSNSVSATVSSGTVTATLTTLTPSAGVTATLAASPTPGPTQPASGPATPTPGPTSAGPTPTPEASQAEKEKAEKEKAKQEALSKARRYALSVGQPTAQAIDDWLARCNSPQLLEALPGKTIGQTYLEMGWKYGVNPAFALAFFTKESSCGTAGDNLSAHNFGNIRWSYGYATLDQVWRAYPTWTAGMEAWFKLIRDNYYNQGARSLADVLPIYAPETENDTTLYMNQVMDWVDTIMLSSVDRNLNLKNSQVYGADGFQIGWDFLDYWKNHGGVATLGWPIGNQEYEGDRIVQYFERAVLEYFPENQPPDQVLLRNVGRKLGQTQPPLKEANQPDQAAIYFQPTGHWLSGRFVQTWEAQGGITQFGYPIAEPQIQGTILIQWFERARFELDLSQSEAPVRLGLVGNEAKLKMEQDDDSFFTFSTRKL